MKRRKKRYYRHIALEWMAFLLNSLSESTFLLLKSSATIQRAIHSQINISFCFQQPYFITLSISVRVSVCVCACTDDWQHNKHFEWIAMAAECLIDRKINKHKHREWNQISTKNNNLGTQNRIDWMILMIMKVTCRVLSPLVTKTSLSSFALSLTQLLAWCIFSIRITCVYMWYTRSACSRSSNKPKNTCSD